MKCIVEREAIGDAAQAGRRLNGAKLSIPILHHAVITASDKLHFLAHNLDASSEIEIGAEILSGGTSTIPIEPLARLTGALPKGCHVTIERVDTQISVSAASSRLLLPTLPPDDALKPLETKGSFDIDLDGETVMRLFDCPQPNICTEATRYYLCGIYLHAVGGKIAACATNGFGLIRPISTIDWPKDAPAIIVPTAATLEILKLAGENGGKFKWSDRTLSLSVPGIKYTTKLVDGTFPGYERVVPEKQDRYLEFDRKELIAALDRLSFMEGLEPVEFVWDNDALEIEITATSDGSGIERIACGSHNIGAARVGFRSHQVAKILTAFSSDNVRFLAPETAAAGYPVHIVDPNEPELLVLQMPHLIKGQTARAA